MADLPDRVGEASNRDAAPTSADDGAFRDDGGGFARWVPQLPSRRSVQIAVGSAILLAVLYAGLMLAYYLDGAGGAYDAQRYDSTAPAGGVLVSLTTRAVDPVAQTMTIDLRVVVDKTLDTNGYEFGQQSPTRNLVVTIHTFDEHNSLDELGFSYPQGKPILGQPVTLSFTGYIRDWPLDRYRTTVEALATAGQTSLPVVVSLAGSVQNWSLSATPVDPAAPADSKSRLYQLEYSRSLGTILFGGAVVLVLITLPILGLTVAIAVYRGRRKLEPAFLSWLAALLFATVPLRNFLPGSPPAGSWVDVSVILWVLIGLVGALVFGVRVWWRDSAPINPDSSAPWHRQGPG